MATGGEDKGQYNYTSDSYTDNFCQPCSKEGKTLQAESFCSECHEFLCQRCTQYHKLLTALQHHKLLNMEEEEKEKPQTKRKDKCTIRCTQHKDKTIKYFCQSHSCLGCSVCITLGHTTCKDVQYIPEASENIQNSEEYQKFVKELKTLASISQDTLATVKLKMGLTEKYHSKAKEAIKQLRSEINKALDKLEDEINIQAKTIKQKQTAKLQAISTICTTSLTEIEAVTSQLDKLQTSQQNCDTFVAMKQGASQLEKLTNGLAAVETETEVRQYIFQPNTELLEMLKKPNIFGKLCPPKEYNAEYVTDINVKSKTDKKDCWITGSTILTNHQLAIIDRRNKKLKILDRKQNKLISELPLPSDPWDVTQITDSQVAVTLISEKRILLVTTSPTLATAGEIKLNGKCWGVEHRAGQLVVTFCNPDKVEIMDLKGHVTHSFTTDDKGWQLFSYPYYATLSPDNKTLYVCNSGNHTVVSLSLDGQVVAMYKDSQLVWPRGVLVKDNCHIYVCGTVSDNIHHIKSDCSKVKLLLTESDGLKLPSCVSHSEIDDMLYVGMEKGDHMKVFRLK